MLSRPTSPSGFSQAVFWPGPRSRAKPSDSQQERAPNHDALLVLGSHCWVCLDRSWFGLVRCPFQFFPRLGDFPVKLFAQVLQRILLVRVGLLNLLFQLEYFSLPVFVQFK